MMKRILTALILVAAVAVSAMAAAKTVTGKVTAIDGTKVTIAIEGERPDWVKKNGAGEVQGRPRQDRRNVGHGRHAFHHRGEHEEGVRDEGRRGDHLREGPRDVRLLVRPVEPRCWRPRGAGGAGPLRAGRFCKLPPAATVRQT